VKRKAHFISHSYSGNHSIGCSSI